jgi:predicted ATPase
VRSAHFVFCMSLAERDQRTMGWQEIASWFDRLEEDHDNLRAALSWLEKSGDVTNFLRLADNLAWFWLYRSHRAEGRRWLGRDSRRHGKRVFRTTFVPGRLTELHS